jgi:hypothetical protein
VGEGELQKIRDLAEAKATRAVEAELSRRQEIKHRSDDRVANWPNTIDAQRLRKEQLRRERLEREEERRQRIDEEEAALREAQKKSINERANTLLYSEGDRVKNFTSKLFLATVLEEREKQLAIKEEKSRLEKQYDAEWAVKGEEELRKAEEAELKKLHSGIERVRALKRAQLEQLEELRQKKIKERDQGIEEGKRIRDAAVDAEAEEKRLEEALKEKQREIARQFFEFKRQEELRKEEQRKAARAEEERIAHFGRQKEAQMMERKTREEEKFANKLRLRQQLIDKQSRELEELRAASEAAELKAMRDFDRERREREEIQEQKRVRLQREIELFRAKQLQQKKEEKEKEAREAQRMSEIWKDRAELLIDEELEERRQEREKADTLQKFHILQAQEKRHQSLLENRNDLEEGLRLQEALREEQDMYTAYVNSVMNEYVSRGRGADVVRMAASRSKHKVV